MRFAFVVLLILAAAACAPVVKPMGPVSAVPAVTQDAIIAADGAVQAFEHALFPPAVAPRALAIPGVSHEVSIDVAVTGARPQAMVKVAFDGVELLRGLHKVDASRPPTFAMHPLQEVQVGRVTVRAFDLCPRLRSPRRAGRRDLGSDLQRQLATPLAHLLPPRAAGGWQPCARFIGTGRSAQRGRTIPAARW